MNLLTHLHPAIIHFPIALLLLGSAMALVHLYHLAGPNPRIDLRRTAWFLIGLGWIAIIPAVLSGLLAQSPLPPDAPYRVILNWHTATGLGLLILYGLLLYQGWIFQGAKARKARAFKEGANAKRGCRFARQPLVACLADSSLGRRHDPTSWPTGWNGGILVYEWGVNVAG